jgi:V/A-type H+-transporting ATPase subunit B
MRKEYTKIKSIVGPLILIEGTSDVSYGEVAEIKLANGESRRGQVLEVSETSALVQYSKEQLV